MLTTFHSFYILFCDLLKRRKARKALENIVQTFKMLEEEVNKHTTTFLDAESNMKFDPPVYKQRYEAVLKVLLDGKWGKHVRKMVDFGCGEFGLFYLVRSLYGLEEVLEVDVDEDLLKEYLFRLRPRTVDYINKRPTPLTVKVFIGSISDPDPNLSGIDAVVAVEVIEHLYPDVLDALPYNIFHNIRPKLVMVTTPNCDFNVFFKDFKKFRHYDHKFEWSREQFQDWANNITSRFPNYTVSFLGIGSPPDGCSDRGHCSQMAVFTKNSELSESSNVPRDLGCGDCADLISFGVCTYYSYSKQTIAYARSDNAESYKLIESIVYPYEETDPDEVVMYDVKYKISVLGRVNGRHYCYDKERAEIPLRELTEWNSDGPYICEGELREILERYGYKIEECVRDDGDKPVLCVIYEPVMENNSPATTDSEFETRQVCDTEEAAQDSDWESLEEYTHSNATDEPEATENALVSNPVDAKPIETKLRFVVNKLQTNSETERRVPVKKQKDASSSSKTSKEPVAGTSSSKKRKKSKKSEEDDALQDVKEIADCIIWNSLNKLDDEPLFQEEVVESNDLANNNRGLEENSYAPEDGDNENVVQRNAEPLSNEDHENQTVDRIAGAKVTDAENEPEEKTGDDDDDDEDFELTFASREALFDPYSKEDLLEDFEIPPVSEAPAAAEERQEEDVAGPFNVVVVGVNINPDVEPSSELFPLWLLHLLGAGVAYDESRNDPHFYCQGDGLGVHPSVMEVDIETSSSSESTSSSHNGTESEHTALESIVSLPEDSEAVGQAVQNTEDQQNKEGNDSSQDLFCDAEEAKEQPSTSNSP